MRHIFEAFLDAERFRMPELYAAVWPQLEAIDRVHAPVAALRAKGAAAAVT